MFLVEQFPRRIQTTLGGWPSRKLRWWNSPVLGHDDVAMPGRVVPHGVVRGPRQADVANVRRFRGRGQSGLEPTGARGSGRAGASRRRERHEAALTLSRERQACPDVLRREIREVAEDLLLGHPRRQVVEDIVDGDPKPADARLAAELVRFDRDALPIVHAAPRIRVGFSRVNLGHAICEGGAVTSRVEEAREDRRQDKGVRRTSAKCLLTLIIL